jgi:hypothetical protein
VVDLLAAQHEPHFGPWGDGTRRLWFELSDFVPIKVQRATLQPGQGLVRRREPLEAPLEVDFRRDLQGLGPSAADDRYVLVAAAMYTGGGASGHWWPVLDIAGLWYQACGQEMAPVPDIEQYLADRSQMIAGLFYVRRGARSRIWGNWPG